MAVPINFDFKNEIYIYRGSVSVFIGFAGGYLKMRHPL